MSLLPASGVGWEGKWSPRKSVSSRPWCWIMVPMAPSRTRMRSSTSRSTGRVRRCLRRVPVFAFTGLTGCRISSTGARRAGIRPGRIPWTGRGEAASGTREAGSSGTPCLVSGGFEDPRRRGWPFSCSRPQYATNRRDFPSGRPVADPYPIGSGESGRDQGPRILRLPRQPSAGCGARVGWFALLATVARMPDNVVPAGKSAREGLRRHVRRLCDAGEP